MYNFAMLFTDRKIKNGTVSEKTSAGYSLHGGIVCFFGTNPIPHCFSFTKSKPTVDRLLTHTNFKLSHKAKHVLEWIKLAELTIFK